MTLCIFCNDFLYSLISFKDGCPKGNETIPSEK